MRIRALLVACLVVIASLIALPADAAGSIQFRTIRYDSPGTDRGGKTSLNAEYVVIKNTGSTTRSLTRWTVRDKAHHAYTFRSFTLKPGKSVKLHSGKGSDTSSNLYWDRGWYVWNNDGDKAILRSSSGTLKDTCTWGDGIGYKNC
jgi:P pilus assembly chaperone PapD